MQTRGPIYITGAERSGTSLLYALLTSHPKIALTRRTNLWAYINQQYGDLKQVGNFKRCLNTLVHYNRISILKLDYDRLWDDFYHGETSYRRLFELIGKQVAERKGKTRWGDKSLNMERYADAIFAAFPDARMLHIIRDPRDRYASALKRWKVIRGGVGSGTGLWLESVSLAKRNLNWYPDQYKIIRYETLIRNTEQTLAEICAFVGEEYSPEMLTMKDEEEFRDEGGNSSYGYREPGKISTSSIGRYHQMLTPRDIAFMQALAGSEMLSFNYPLDPVRFTPKEQVIFNTTELPLNLAKMYTWKLREKFLDRKGRNIPPYRIVPDSRTVQV